MSTVLLDTTVVSLLHPKKKNSPIRALYESHLKDAILAISFQSVAELWKWAEKQNWGDKTKAGLDEFIKRFLVYPYDYELAKIWAHVSAHSESIGRRLEAGDAWVIATAVHRKIPLLAHDKDMADLIIPDLNVISFVNLET